MDSPERAQNLDLVVEQLMALKDSIRMEIRILEADEHPHYELKISDEHIHKTFVRDASPVFHRTKYLNRLMQEAEGAIVGIWDTDVLLPKEQILEAVDAIRKGNAVMSFPYDGRFYMLPQEDSMLLKKREMNMEECCQKIYEYEGSTKISRDTLNVVIAKSEFYHLEIQIKRMNGNWADFGMRYLNDNTFYGYHSDVTFSKDSIFYRQNGPLGYYYSDVYKGRKIK